MEHGVVVDGAAGRMRKTQFVEQVVAVGLSEEYGYGAGCYLGSFVHENVEGVDGVGESFHRVVEFRRSEGYNVFEPVAGLNGEGLVGVCAKQVGGESVVYHRYILVAQQRAVVCALLYPVTDGHKPYVGAII